jgi:RES domain-containing protein
MQPGCRRGAAAVGGRWNERRGSRVIGRANYLFVVSCVYR